MEFGKTSKEMEKVMMIKIIDVYEKCDCHTDLYLWDLVDGLVKDGKGENAKFAILVWQDIKLPFDKQGDFAIKKIRDLFFNE